LDGAKTSAEVLEAKAQAQAALHYAKITKAATETQAVCLKIIVRAESRMADEVDAGQERGEIAKPNQPVSQYVGKSDIPSTLSDIGVTRQQVHDFRKVRDAGPEKIDAIIDDAVEQGRVPSRAEILLAIDPNVDPSPPEGFAEKIQVVGQISELAKKLEQTGPSLIAGASEIRDADRVLRSMEIISSWGDRFSTHWSEKNGS
jgi:hypothetical protein